MSVQTAPEQKQFYEELRNVWHEMKNALKRHDEEVKRLGEATAETKQEIDRLNQRLDQLEVMAKRPVLGSSAKAETTQSEAKSAFLKALRYGINALSPEEKQYVQIDNEKKAMILGDDTTGGYLAPPEYVNEIIKGVVDFSPIRPLARVRTTSYRSVVVPVRTGTVAARWVSETRKREETGNPKYGREEIQTHEMYALVLVSLQDLEDTAFDLEGEIREECAEQFGVAEGAAFLLGDGVDMPEGLLVNPNVQEDVTGDPNNLTAEALIDMCYNLKAPYAQNAVWVMNRRTIGKIRMMKGQDGQFIWQPGLAPGQPNTILDRPYVEAADMPEVAPNSTPVLFGDIRRAYTIVDRVQMTFQRLNEKYAEFGQVGIMVRKRVGGQVVLPEAVRKLRVSG